jgi:APA family basic amino acid/polyamine antiporter
MAANDVQFSRVLRRADILALAFGAMVGWGWVVLAGTQVKDAGSFGACLAFVVGGFAVFLIGLTYAELCSAMPKAGGEHIYSYRALGVAGSFVCTWSIVLGYVSVVAFEAVALPTVLDYIWPGYAVGHLWTVAGWEVQFTWVLVGVTGAAVMTWVNLIGVQFSATVQKGFTLLLGIVGVMLIFGSWPTGDTANLNPFFVDGMAGMFTVLIMVPFLFVGFDVIPQAAEEIDLPYKMIGRILLFSVILATAWYALIVLAVAVSLTGEQLEGSELATADALANVVGGAWGGKLLVFAGVCGILTSWNAFFIGGSRAIYAMAHSRMLPAFLGNLHPKYKTPYNAIILMGVLSMIAPLFGRKALVWLVDAGGFGIIVAYVLVAWSFIKLRQTEPEMERPYKVPYGHIVGPAALVLGIGISLLYLPFSPAALVWPTEWLIVLLWAALGAVFWFWARFQYGDVQDGIMRREVESVSVAGAVPAE